MIKPLVAVFTVAVGSSPSYQTILGDLGFSDNVQQVTMKIMEGDVKGAVKHIPDEMAKQVTLCGTENEVRQRLQEYRNAGDESSHSKPYSTIRILSALSELPPR